jgi:dynein heavy chain 1
MKRAGCKQEKLSFIFDESNILSIAFMERMNALLASGEIPGLFENEEYSSLLANMREFHKNTASLDDDQIYKLFVKNV